MYKVFFTEEAENLDKAVAQRLLKKLHWLAKIFEAMIPESLTAQW